MPVGDTVNAIRRAIGAPRKLSTETLAAVDTEATEVVVVVGGRPGDTVIPNANPVSSLVVSPESTPLQQRRVGDAVGSYATPTDAAPTDDRDIPNE